MKINININKLEPNKEIQTLLEELHADDYHFEEDNENFINVDNENVILLNDEHANTLYNFKTIALLFTLVLIELIIWNPLKIGFIKTTEDKIVDFYKSKTTKEEVKDDYTIVDINGEASYEIINNNGKTTINTDLSDEESLIFVFKDDNNDLAFIEDIFRKGNIIDDIPTYSINIYNEDIIRMYEGAKNIRIVKINTKINGNYNIDLDYPYEDFNNRLNNGMEMSIYYGNIEGD